jgi:hypothetical protein
MPATPPLAPLEHSCAAQPGVVLDRPGIALPKLTEPVVSVLSAPILTIPGGFGSQSIHFE